MSPYLQDLLDNDQITAAEYRVLAPSGAKSPEELFALTLHFAQLFAQALPGGNLAKISALAAKQTPMAFRNVAMAALAAPPQMPLGALQPQNAPYPIGTKMGQSNVPPQAAGPTLAGIDHHSKLRAMGWPVQNQGQRGTCVAHAMTACKEHHASASKGVSPNDQSEQFLFWGAKQFDPDPGDGTLNTYALDALRKHGSCDEGIWPYVGAPVYGSVHQGPPPTTATTAGLKSLHVGGGVSAPSNAGALYKQLQQGPVSIGVPVFADPNNLQRNNWNVGGLFNQGIVAEPPAFSIVAGGHAVCVVGFEPDSAELAGVGWFVIRNSWGTQFGGNLPQLPAAFGPEAGYGQISWAHVDQYLWEMAWLW